ncbi:MAG: hypothetical protein A2V75_09060 [Actinobacteria bacterium RBG_16_70_17]|nr:MAG: hypothetical protein A2V75_09060 [Actinobacteria bacterium RBG_16_70_17]
MLWVSAVTGDTPAEVAKSRQHLSAYLTKLYQEVRQGRSVNYSRAWPKLPKPAKPQHAGRITWTPERWLTYEVIMFEDELRQHWWTEARPWEYHHYYEAPCHCWDRPESPSVPRPLAAGRSRPRG